MLWIVWPIPHGPCLKGSCNACKIQGSPWLKRPIKRYNQTAIQSCCFHVEKCEFKGRKTPFCCAYKPSLSLLNLDGGGSFIISYQIVSWLPHDLALHFQGIHAVNGGLWVGQSGQLPSPAPPFDLDWGPVFWFAHQNAVSLLFVS